MRILGQLPSSLLDTLATTLDELRTLDDAVRWAFAEGFELDVEPMDEFTHDVIAQRPGEPWAVVFDAT